MMNKVKSTLKGVFAGMVFGLPLSVFIIFMMIRISANNENSLLNIGDSSVSIIIYSILLAGLIGGFLGYAKDKHPQ